MTPRTTIVALITCIGLACGSPALVDGIEFAQYEDALGRVPGQRIPGAEQGRVLQGNVAAHQPHGGPQQLSLRPSMSPVKHQGARHTCATFALVALLEAAGSPRLSEQCISYLNPGGDPSFVWEGLQRVEKRGFLVDADRCPYDPVDRGRVPSEIFSSWPAAPLPGVATARAFPAASGDDPVAFLRAHLAEHSPVALSFYLFGPFWTNRDAVAQVAADFVPRPDHAQRGDLFHGTHTVVAVGYDDVAQTVEIKNSWGTSWKDGGYARLSYAYVRRFHSNHPANNPMVAYSRAAQSML